MRIRSADCGSVTKISQIRANPNAPEGQMKIARGFNRGGRAALPRRHRTPSEGRVPIQNPMEFQRGGTRMILPPSAQRTQNQTQGEDQRAKPYTNFTNSRESKRPGGANENSPRFQPRGRVVKINPSPGGAAENLLPNQRILQLNGRKMVAEIFRPGFNSRKQRSRSCCPAHYLTDFPLTASCPSTSGRTARNISRPAHRC